MAPEEDASPKIQLAAAAASDVGQRRHQEDFTLIRDDLLLYLVADGAGGHKAGDVASALAARVISNFVGATVRATHEKPEYDQFGLPTGARRLATAIRKANHDILEISRTHRQHRGMGTTVVALSFSPRSGLMHVAHVGDSRCYRLREGHLELMTQDHSLLTDVLEDRPDLDDAVLANLPKHVVTRALGMKENVRVSIRSHSVADGDRFLLCSDGLSAPVSAQAIADTLDLDEPPETIVSDLIRLAKDGGGRDNISALVVDCTGGPEVTLPPDPRRRAPQRPAAPPRPGEPSMPELLILGIEEIEVDGRPSFALIPAETATADLTRALDDLVKTGRDE